MFIVIPWALTLKNNDAILMQKGAYVPPNVTIIAKAVQPVWYLHWIKPEFHMLLWRFTPRPQPDKDTTESTTSASYLDLLLSIGRDGQLHTSIYDKRDDFNFHITNFPFLSSNIPSSPAYGVFISQLIRYARACSS